LLPLPNEDPPFVVPVSTLHSTPRSVSLTPLVLDERAISRLLELMISRGGLTVSEVARRMAVTPQAVRQYIHGRRSPTIKQLLKFAEATGSRILVEYAR